MRPGHTPPEQGLDHGGDLAVIRFFAWRFPKIELVAFFACRDYPYTQPHHIVCFEGDRQSLAGYGLIAPDLIPTALRRRRSAAGITAYRIKKNHFLVRVILWQDTPLASLHPLSPLCPTRWPIIDSADTWKDYMRERLLPVLDEPLRIVHALRSTLLGYCLEEKDAARLQTLLEQTAKEFRKRFEDAKVVRLQDMSLKVISGENKGRYRNADEFGTDSPLL
jgi:hypothetical protein